MPPSTHLERPSATSTALAERYRNVRLRTEALCEPLAVEDFVVQSMPEASPVKWHLAHTTWFFETVVLAQSPDYSPRRSEYGYLFNSYYETFGARACRSLRGTFSRPTVEEIFKYREYVDGCMWRLLESSDGLSPETVAAVTLGLEHEQQHQELILTDVKHAFAMNPLKPIYRPADDRATDEIPQLEWHDYPGGLRAIGHGGDCFAYDNELPRHDEFVRPFRLASRAVTNREYLAFIEEGGYSRPDAWLSDGWAVAQAGRWAAPLYWENIGGKWWTMTLAGMREIENNEPVCHVSYYEADAFARWWGHRLPTEAEWETAAHSCAVEGNFAESGRFHPEASGEPLLREDAPTQMFGDVWEWTQSAYLPYPGHRRAAGAVGEYNAKFMSGQMVLRGGSCATPQKHIRASYRNYFAPATRWQFSGIRMAEDR
jgi:ergothioneine biosynthesis protein EgtB